MIDASVTVVERQVQDKPTVRGNVVMRWQRVRRVRLLHVAVGPVFFECAAEEALMLAAELTRVAEQELARPRA